MRDLAPDVMRKRVLIEAKYTIEVSENIVRDFLTKLPKALDLRIYADPIVHMATGQGKTQNSGYDAFVPLIDSGIYLGIWTVQNFLSSVVYTCKDFSTEKAVEFFTMYFKTTEIEFKEF